MCEYIAGGKSFLPLFYQFLTYNNKYLIQETLCRTLIYDELNDWWHMYIVAFSGNLLTVKWQKKNTFSFYKFTFKKKYLKGFKIPQNMVADTLCWSSAASWFCIKQPELLKSKEPLKRCYSKIAPGEQILHLYYICIMYNNILSRASEGVDEVKSKAVNEMMERIKHGVVLRPVKSQESKVRTTPATIMSCFLNSQHGHKK